MGVLQDLNLKPGVIYGDDVLKLFTYAKEKGFAMPAVNVVCCCRPVLRPDAVCAFAYPANLADLLFHRCRYPRGRPRLQVACHPAVVRLNRILGASLCSLANKTQLPGRCCLLRRQGRHQQR